MHWAITIEGHKHKVSEAQRSSDERVSEVQKACNERVSEVQSVCEERVRAVEDLLNDEEKTCHEHVAEAQKLCQALHTGTAPRHCTQALHPGTAPWHSTCHQGLVFITSLVAAPIVGHAQPGEQLLAPVTECGSSSVLGGQSMMDQGRVQWGSHAWVVVALLCVTLCIVY